MLQSVYHRLDGRYGNCTKSNHNDVNIYHDKYQVSLGLQSSLLKKIDLAITLLFIQKKNALRQFCDSINPGLNIDYIVESGDKLILDIS